MPQWRKQGIKVSTVQRKPERKKKKKRAASQVEQRMRGENAGVMLQRKQRKEKRKLEADG